MKKILEIITNNEKESKELNNDIKHNKTNDVNNNNNNDDDTIYVKIGKREYSLDKNLVVSIIEYLQKNKEDKDKAKFENDEDIIEYMNKHQLTNVEFLEYVKKKQG